MLSVDPVCEDLSPSYPELRTNAESSVLDPLLAGSLGPELRLLPERNCSTSARLPPHGASPSGTRPLRPAVTRRVWPWGELESSPWLMLLGTLGFKLLMAG